MSDEIKLYDCPHCLARGVLLMSDGKCPNCKNKVDVVENVSKGSSEPICPLCGSAQFKRRFFSGSKGGAIACFILGGYIAFEDINSRRRIDPAVLIFLIIFILAGIVALTSKKYKCFNCKKSFDNPKS